MVQYYAGKNYAPVPSLGAPRRRACPRAEGRLGLAILLNSQMQKALYQGRVQLDQPLYGPIAYRALTISVETKVPGEGAQDAINQAAA